ncbi:MAG: ankyrin repeat domain-containing protein [Rickettsiales bacterium]
MSAGERATGGGGRKNDSKFLKDFNESLLHHGRDFTESIRELKERGLINTRDDEGFSPLHHALFHGNTKVLLTLVLSAEADYTIADGEGNTIFHKMAASGFYPKALCAFTEHMTDIMYLQNNQGQTPLDVARAANNGHFLSATASCLKENPLEYFRELANTLEAEVEALRAPEGNMAIIARVFEENTGVSLECAAIAVLGAAIPSAVAYFMGGEGFNPEDGSH